MSGNKVVVASEALKALLEELKEKISKKYNSNVELMLDYQLFGYGNYKEELPSIRKLIFDETEEWINGKYLYNKYKEVDSGSRSITFSREYKHLFFQVLGYKDYHDFLNRSSRSEITSIKNQLSELDQNPEKAEQNFIGYSQGENSQIISSNLRLHNSRKSAEWTLYYYNSEGAMITYQYFGKVNQNEKGTSIYFPADESSVSRSAFICIFNDDSIKSKIILLGCYAGYDEIWQPTCGEILFLRTSEKYIPSNGVLEADPAIIQYLCDKRVNIEAKFPDSLYDLTPNSKYAFQLQDLIGEFHGVVLNEKHELIHIKLNIYESLIRCTIQIEGTTYNGFMQLIANSVIQGQFHTTAEEKISIFIKLNYNINEILTGYLTGYSKANSIWSGKMALTNSQKHVDEINIFLSQKNEDLLKKYLVKNFQSFISRSYNGPNSEIATTGHLNASSQNLAHLKGLYKIYYRDSIKNEITVNQLELNNDGEFIIEAEEFTYTGSASIFGNNVLSLNINKCNGLDFQSQLQLFIGRLSGSKIRLSTGTWQIIDEIGKFSSFRVCLSSSGFQRSSYDSELNEHLPKSGSKIHSDSFIMH